MKTLLLAALLVPICHADTVLFLDGTKLDGKVLSENAEKCVLQVQIGRGIKDEREFPKSKIKKIIRETPDIAAFDAIHEYANTPDLLPLKEYNTRIAAVEQFLTTYPDGSKRPDAKNILAKLQPERDAIATGSIKFGGKLISAAAYADNAYDIDAKILAAEIKRLAQADQIIPALRKFSEFDKTFSGSAVFNDTLPTHLAMMQSFYSRISAAADAQEKLAKERKTGFAMMSDADRTRALRIVKDEDEEYTKLLAAERAAKEKWLSIEPYHKDVIVETARNIQQEVQHLQNYRPANGTATAEPGDVFRKVRNTVTTSTDEKTIATAIQSAQTARLPDHYINLLKHAKHN
jgi:hypothetical protein